MQCPKADLWRCFVRRFIKITRTNVYKMAAKRWMPPLPGIFCRSIYIVARRYTSCLLSKKSFLVRYYYFIINTNFVKRTNCWDFLNFCPLTLIVFKVTIKIVIASLKRSVKMRLKEIFNNVQDHDRFSHEKNFPKFLESFKIKYTVDKYSKSIFSKRSKVSTKKFYSFL